MSDEHEVVEIARKIRYDLTALQGKVTVLLTALGELDLPAPSSTVCPVCDVTLRGKFSLAEHVYHSHDGPVPEHWLLAEAATE